MLMFTGLVDHCGVINVIDHTTTGMQLRIATEYTDLEEGESIAVNGMCLTAVDLKPGEFSAQLSPDTIAVTAVNSWSEGDHVNLERALKASDRFGGHFVSGHVETVAEVRQVNSYDEFTEVIIGSIIPSDMQYLIQKGSVAVNGVSLTINGITEDGFKLMLVPHTQERTNLKTIKVSDPVHIEFDMLAKMVAKQLESRLVEA